jgi:flavin reductase (DIM6/NTAB) family NADH-FMN oxidoreductase RutF
MEPSQTAFKEALGAWATGVAVVGARHDDLDYGTTVSSFTSVSLDPPLVLVSLGVRARIAGMLDTSGRFSVSVLEVGQQAAGSYFATPGRDPSAGFGSVEVDRCPNGLPLVRGALAHLSCTLEARLTQGDHGLYVGRVAFAHGRGDGRPLLYFRREYHSL